MRKWQHTVESTVVERWLAQQLDETGDKVQVLVNSLLLAVAQGRLVDPAPLRAKIEALEAQVRQQQDLLVQVIRPGATIRPSDPPSSESPSGGPAPPATALSPTGTSGPLMSRWRRDKSPT